MTRKQRVIEMADEIGLAVDTWSPGDGLTRYRFLSEGTDYFGGRSVYTALGIKEAEEFIIAAHIGYGLAYNKYKEDK